MKRQRLGDTDIEALIGGRPANGVPMQLKAMLSTMREQVQIEPSVPISGALSEFIIDGNPSAVPVNAEIVAASSNRAGRADPPDVPLHTAGTPIDPCQAAASPVVSSTPSNPVDPPGRNDTSGTGPRASAPGNNGTNPGSGNTTITTPPKETGQGRTPR